MKRIILLTLLTFSFFFGQSQGIQRWFEDFENEANGAVTQAGASVAGTPGGTWSVTTTPSGGAASFSRQNHSFNRFTINDTGNEGVWATNVVDISSTGQAALDISLVTYNANSSDYVRAYYKLNGGAEVMFGEMLGGGYSIGQNASVVLTGTSVQIIVRGMDNTAGSTGGFPNMMRFDDVEITQVSTLYSRNGGGNWGTSGVWSTVGLNGVSCGCTPDNTTNVVVGNADVVSITAASDAISVTVQNTSTLRWTTDAVALNLARGGSLTISNTAQVNRNGNAGAQIIFPSAAVVGLTVNSSNANALTIGDILVTGAPAMTISGTGNINVGDDFLVSGAATIVNNLSGTIAIGDVLTINPVAGATFTNAGPITIGGVITINTPSTLTNNNTITASSTAAGALTGTGTFTQGTNSTLNYAGNTITITTFSASNFGNKVDYNRGGAQTMVATTYYNLTLSNSGAKSLVGTATLRGNWVRSGTATFTPGTSTVSFNALAGTAAQSITAVGGETFNSLTINSAFATAPQITFNNAVTANVFLNMASGIVNLNGNTFTLGVTGTTSGIARTASTTSNWMYGGTFKRFWKAGVAVTATDIGLFPVGASTASSYRPVQITSTISPLFDGFFTVTHNQVAGITDLSPVYSDVGTNITRIHNAQFTTAISGAIGGTYNIDVTMTGLPAGTLSDIRLAVSTGGTTASAKGLHAAATGTAQNPTAKRTGIVTLSDFNNDFRIATTNKVATPLPIDLLYFKAKLDQNEVNLNWATAQEINNDFFTVEKSSNPEKGFQQVLKVAGQGNSSSKQEYFAEDRSPFVGLSYYRLKQTDFDGTSTYSDLVSVNYEGSTLALLKVYPNPLKDKQTFKIEISGLKGISEVPLVIYNFLGQKILEKSVPVNYGGIVQEEFFFEKPLATGVFVIKAGPTLQLTQRLVVE